ncbi:Signal transduction histidine kinase [Nakamurella panacisegetis]|uniref:histidine kinase n=1 Tax=Nakamurella panacisegetis TaxID=1090615 RepID=A0A1H0IRE8_9ACTN|nr:ATP-binding protein [Nakamurella panacisegetis]SDO33860.1 Signal transduction histidine kinase [Nakamurella panacisegetis]
MTSTISASTGSFVDASSVPAGKTAPPVRLRRLRAFATGFARDQNSVLQRQLCVLVVYVASQLILLVPDVNITHGGLIGAGALVMVGATGTAYGLRKPRIPSRWAMVVPLLSIVSIGLLRAGTGGAFSVFTMMLVLPTVSLGVEPGRLPLLFGGLVMVPIMWLPILFDPTTFQDGQWTKVVFIPVMLGLTCLSVNELMTRLRARVRAVNALQRRQQDLLVDATANAARSEMATAAARESTSQLINVIDSVTEQAIIATDVTGAVEVFNSGAQKMLRIAAHDVLGRSILQFHLRDELDARMPEIADGATGSPFDALTGPVRKGVPAAADWTYRTADGKDLRVHLTVTSRSDASGRGDGFLFVATDVTEDREQSRVKDDFVNLISHELRTPLSSILGYLELLGDDEDNPLSPEQTQFLEVISRNANRLLRLVSDLLFTAQVEAGRFDLQGQSVDLRTVVTASWETAAPLAADRGLTLRMFTPEEPVMAWGDPIRLGQVVDNLISNAVKFTPAGGRIVLNLTTPDDETGRALICITDTGLGIPATELDRLFSRFFRASTATDNAVPGVGLGLNITKAIVTAHGGRITVASTVGQGTTFAVELPLGDQST